MYLNWSAGVWNPTSKWIRSRAGRAIRSEMSDSSYRSVGAPRVARLFGTCRSVLLSMSCTVAVPARPISPVSGRQARGPPRTWIRSSVDHASWQSVSATGWSDWVVVQAHTAPEEVWRVRTQSVPRSSPRWHEPDSVDPLPWPVGEHSRGAELVAARPTARKPCV